MILIDPCTTVSYWSKLTVLHEDILQVVRITYTSDVLRLSQHVGTEDSRQTVCTVSLRPSEAAGLVNLYIAVHLNFYKLLMLGRPTEFSTIL